MTAATDLDTALTALTDRQLVRLARYYRDVLRDVQRQDVDLLDAADELYLLVVGVLARREHVTEEARIMLDANGHEVWVDYEPHVSPPGWWAYCWCTGSSLGDRVHPTREAAVQVAADHAAERGGAWASWTQQEGDR